MRRGHHGAGACRREPRFPPCNPLREGLPRVRIEKAEQLDDVAVRVAGASFDEVLANKITGMTPAAAALGITPDMTGREAAEILNQQ